MTVITTLGPLLIALLFGYWVNIKFLTPKRVAIGLEKLVYLILGLIGFSIGALENVTAKLAVAGYQAVVLFSLITLLSLSALYLTGRRFGGAHGSTQSTIPQASKRQALKDAAQTLAWVMVGIFLGFMGKDWAMGVNQAVTGLLYVLLLLVGCQLRQGNHRLRKLLLNKQAVIIASTTIASTLLAGWISGFILDISWQQSLAVVSGFGWYSLSGILITGLGDPVLGTTAFLLDLGREIVALMLIPFFAKRSSHMSVGYSGATAMDFTLPILSKFHGPEIVPVCIASGFIMSLLVPILIPLFLGMH